MKKFIRILEVIWWMLRILKHVDKVVVYQVPNLVSKTPSRVFGISDKYFDYSDYNGEEI